MVAVLVFMMATLEKKLLDAKGLFGVNVLKIPKLSLWMLKLEV